MSLQDQLQCHESYIFSWQVVPRESFRFFGQIFTPDFLLAGGTTGCSPECRPRRCCDRTPREATSSAKSSLPATPPTPRRQEPALRQAGRPVGGKMQAVGTFLEATKTWAGWTTALPSSMCSLFLLPLLISKWAGFCFISEISIRGQQPFPNMAAMK